MSQQYDPDANEREVTTGDEWAGEETLLVGEDDLGAPGANSVEEVQVDFDRLDAGGEDGDFESDGSEDNPYLESDQVLLDDSEEAAMGRALVPPEEG